MAGRHAWQEGAWQGVCMAGDMRGRGACMAGGMHGGGGHAWQGGVHGRRDGHCSDRYASYWNAFLLACDFGRKGS